MMLKRFREFLSTPSARRATHHRYQILTTDTISIHALREEGDAPACRQQARGPNFYPRPPRGGRRRGRRRRFSPAGYFYPRPPRGGRQHPLLAVCSLFDFYPRPPRGGRPISYNSSPTLILISIHALREEGDLRQAIAVQHILISIHALREEGDVRLRQQHSSDRNFYPRPPRGGRPCPFCGLGRQLVFLSTPSARRATSLQ